MRLYQLHFYDASGGRPVLDFSECEDDGAAAREAFRGLRHHMSCRGVEVYDGDRLVARVERPDPRPTPLRHGVHGTGRGSYQSVGNPRSI